MLITSILITFIYLFSWVKFQKYQFLERDYSIVHKHKEYSKSWHSWKGVNHISFFILLTVGFGLDLALINAIFFWIMFDGLLNKIVLKQTFFYIGKTAKTDNLFHIISDKIKNKVSAITLSAVTKISLLIISILLYL